MNRAWIPAGALAGVSVAGLIALGQLTDSLGTQVSFSGSVSIDSPAPTHTAVPVSLDSGTVGQTGTAAFTTQRGGAAAATSTNSDLGQVGYRQPPSSHSNSVAAPTTTVRSTPPAKPKKTVPRRTSIGAISGPNTDQGLATGGATGQTGRGEQSSKLAPETP
jgi:hypothetical protein